ncbi:MAG: SGNH/GDSL hydrolase family protein [Candidatus Saccharimonadales bacterium]
MKTICIFGDSVTWGRGLKKRTAWVNLLRDYLEDKDERIHLYDLGIDGNATVDVIDRFSVESKSRKPDVVVWAIGTNDSAYKKTLDNPVASKDEFAKNLERLYQQAGGANTSQLFVGIAKGIDTNTKPLPESTTGKCYEKARVAEYDLIIREIAQKNSTAYVNISDSLVDEDFYDGLHPNERGHMKMFLKLQPEIEKLI